MKEQQDQGEGCHERGSGGDTCKGPRHEDDEGQVRRRQADPAAGPAPGQERREPTAVGPGGYLAQEPRDDQR